MQTRKSRTLLASGGNEPVSDIGGVGHSVFANAFLTGLTNIDLNEFTAEELYIRYIKEMVVGSADQTPEYNIIRNSGHEGGDFVFKKKFISISSELETLGRCSGCTGRLSLAPFVVQRG
jgi:hypothetical protein